MLNLITKIIFILFIPMVSLAAVPAWQIMPSASSIEFTATQNGAPVSGKFKTFTGEINFDPQQLSASSVHIIVDMASVFDPYNQLSDTLKTADWFDVKLFPQAIFVANEFTKLGDNSYQAKGTLTIRDKKVPVTLSFNLQEYSPTKAVAKGTTMLKRTTFGVGQGEWSDTSTIKDDVRVDFTLSAIKK